MYVRAGEYVSARLFSFAAGLLNVALGAFSLASARLDSAVSLAVISFGVLQFCLGLVRLHRGRI